MESSAVRVFDYLSTTDSISTTPSLSGEKTNSYIVTGIAFSLLLFVYLPFSLYYAWMIYTLRSSLIIHKRFPYLILVTVLGNCLYMLTEKSLLFLCNVGIIASDKREQIDFILTITIHCGFIYALYLTVLRFWLLYFKLEWALSNINNQWQSIINSREQHKDWFLRNKKTYGSFTWLIRKTLLVTTLIVLVHQLSSVLARQLDHKLHQAAKYAIGCAVYGPAVLVTIYIVWKLPEFDDYLLIRKEAKFSLFVFFIIVLAHFGTLTIENWIEIDYELEHILVRFALYMVTMIAYFALNYKQTRWVIRKFHKVIRRFSSQTMKRIAFGDNTDKDQGYQKLNDAYSSSPEMSKKNFVQLRHIFSHDRAFDQFMNYLYKQHCAEVLLSFTEMTQFQQLLYDDLSIILDDDDDADGDPSMLSPKIEFIKRLRFLPNLPTVTPKVFSSMAMYNNHNRDNSSKPFAIHVDALNANEQLDEEESEEKATTAALELSEYNVNALQLYKNSDRHNLKYALANMNKRDGVEIMDPRIDKMTEVLNHQKLPPSVPRSSIVHHRFGTEDTTRSPMSSDKSFAPSYGNPLTKKAAPNLRGKLKKYRNIAWDIYNKYIRIGADYEINIDHASRKRYQRLMANKTEWVNHTLLNDEQYIQEVIILFEIFQPCINSMYRFCSSCFSTFKSTADFERLMELFTIKGVSQSF